jgi:hypothetical protein
MAGRAIVNRSGDRRPVWASTVLFIAASWFNSSAVAFRSEEDGQRDEAEGKSCQQRVRGVGVFPMSAQFLPVSPVQLAVGAQLKHHEDLGPDLYALEEVQNVLVEHADAAV